MVMRELDQPLVVGRSWLGPDVTYRDWEDPIVSVSNTVKALGYERSRIGQELDSHFLTVKTAFAIRGLLSKATFADLSGVTRLLMARKSPAEIECHRAAARVADLGMQAGVEALKEGISERELAAAIYARALSEGADNNAPRIALIGVDPAAAAFHRGVTGSRVRRDTPIHIELLPQVNSYSSRLMRTAVVGELNTHLASVFDRLVVIQDRQLAAIRPGAVAGEIDRIARASILEAGLRNSYINNTGYGLGVIVSPRLGDFDLLFVPDATWLVEDGMVFHMYVSGAGLSISETVLVTPTGHERLTHTDRRVLSAPS
jgi:Xaa-Pro dipeptidase